MSRHRIFIAIGISKNLQKKILDWKKSHLLDFSSGPRSGISDVPKGRGNRWEIKFIKKHPSSNVRWLVPKNLHVTLIPPWYEDEQGLEKVQRLLKKFSASRHFEILFHKISYGPDPKRPRLIWIEGTVPPEIIKLKTRLEEMLSQKSEARAFKTHLTIARFRPEHFSSFAVKKLNEKISWREAVTSFALMESRLSPRGADYQILLTGKL